MAVVPSPRKRRTGVPGSDPNGVEWANFLDQELARRDTRQYFLWSVTLAVLGASYWLAFQKQAFPSRADQLAASLCIGALVYWVALRKLRQRFTSSTLPNFLVRHVTPVQFLLPIRYYRAVGVPPSVRSRHIFEALAALAVVPAAAYVLPTIVHGGWLTKFAIVTLAMWIAWQIVFVLFDGKTVAAFVSWFLLVFLAFPSVQKSWGFGEEDLRELRGGRSQTGENIPTEHERAADVSFRLTNGLQQVVTLGILGYCLWEVARGSGSMATRAGFATSVGMWKAGAAFALAIVGIDMLLTLAFDRTRLRLEALRTEAFTRFPGHKEMDQAFRVIELLRNSEIHDEYHPLNVAQVLLSRPRIEPSKS